MDASLRILGATCILAAVAFAQERREPVAAGGTTQRAAEIVVEADAGEVCGTILVDGLPPEWPILLYLRENVLVSKSNDKSGGWSYARGVTLTPAERGAFSFTGVPRAKLTLSVTDFHFADGGSTLELAGPARGLVLQLESRPEIVGRILGPDGEPMAQLSGMCELRDDAFREADGLPPCRGFTSRQDGRFRVPVEDASRSAALKLLVEQEQCGFLLHESVRALAPRLDLGDLRLEPVRRLRFIVRDPTGSPIPFAFGEIDGARWELFGPRCTPDGNGELFAVPARPVDVRFGAHRFAELVVRVGSQASIDVVLEPLTTLEVRLVDPRTGHVLLVAERSAFDWDVPGRDAAAVYSDRHWHWQGASMRRSPSSTEGHIVYEILPRDTTLALVGVTPDLVLAVEARDNRANVLGASTIALRAGEHAALELGTPDPSGKLPMFGGQSARQVWPSLFR